jgi:hypothetical protein
VDFYATAAQVIPTLFLAMAFESRALLRLPTSYNSEADPQDARWWNATQIVGMFYYVAAMACGEVSALIALYGDKGSGLTNGLTWLGLLGGLAGVVVPVLDHQWGLLRRHFRAVGLRGELPTLGFLLAGLAILTFSFLSWFAN